MHLVGWLPSHVDDREATRAARSCGIVVTPLSFFAVDRKLRKALLLGYAALTTEQIATGTKRLATVLRPLLRRAVRG